MLTTPYHQEKSSRLSGRDQILWFMFDWGDYNHAGQQKLLAEFLRIVSAEKMSSVGESGANIWIYYFIFTNSKKEEIP